MPLDETVTSTITSSSAGKPHRRHIQWQRAAPRKKSLPYVLNATRKAFKQALFGRSGVLWWRIARVAPVSGYNRENALHRVRALRSDIAEDTIYPMLCTLLEAVDVQTGFVGRPRPEGGPWYRYTLTDLAQLAYQSQDGASLRRAQRALDVITSMGWMHPSQQVRWYDKAKDGFKAEANVRRLNLKRLCDMAGTLKLLKSALKAMAKKATRKRPTIGKHRPKPAKPSPEQQRQERERRETGAKHIREILDMLAGAT